MGGKTGTSTTTSTTQIPKEVLARYNAVNAYASDVAKTPFQPYTGQFVAGLTPTQQAGIGTTSQYAQAAQPYYQAATQQLMGAQQSALPGISAAYQNVGGAQDVGAQYAQAASQGIGGALQYAQPYQAGATQAAMMGAQGIQPGQLQTQQYMNPYTQAVAAPTYQALQQQQQEQMAGQLGNAIRSGAFGGDRAALAAANLARQQQLGMAQAMAPIYQQGYGQALQTAQQQQGVQLGAEQANRAALQNLAQQLQGLGQAGYGQQMGAAQQYGALGQQQYGQGMGAAQQLAGLAQQGYGMGAGTAQALAGLGTQAQQAGLQGAQAQLGAGTLEQQTQQADLTARYQQFLQERGYPFQVAQFLANIAMGTGALSGSTTASTSSYPMPFFSDRRVKDDVKEIGKTNDGQPIYSFKYKGDDRTQIGLMAQDVEKKHPEAVGEYGGIKTVDYKKATEDAERTGRYEGGLVPASMGGAVNEPGAYGRGGFEAGGGVDPNDLQAILAMQQQALGPFGEMGLYGRAHAEGQPFAMEKGIIPKSRLHVPKMLQGKVIEPQKPQDGLGAQALQALDQGKKLYGDYQAAKEMLKGKPTPQEEMDKSRPTPTAADTAKMAGPDIVPAKSSQEQGWGEWLASKFFSEGGVVPRGHFVKGGTAFSDPYQQYEVGEGQIPEELLTIEPPEQQKQPSQQSGAPSGASQSGIGLGDIAKLAMFFLKDGGAVPRGHLQAGGVYDPTMRRMIEPTEMTPEKIAELNKEDVYSRELQPGVAPRFRTFERMAREQGADIKPTELFRTPERSAILDLTMPEGAPRAKPYASGHSYGLAGDFAGITEENLPAVRAAAKATGLTLGEDFSNPDRPHVQYTKGSFGSLAPRFGQQLDLPEGSKDVNLGGVVPAELQDAAYAKAREVLAAKGIEPTSKEGQTMMPQVVSFLEKNQGWLVPFGAGIRGMVQSKSPFLGGALLEGLGTGMEAVGASQQQLADLAKKQADIRSTLSNITGPLIGEFDKEGKLVYRPQYKYMPDFYEAPTEGLGETQKQVIEQSRESVQQPSDPVVVKAEGNQYNWDVVPTNANDQTFAKIGFQPTGDPNLDAQKLAVIYKMQPDVAAAAINDAKIADEKKKQSFNTSQTKRETNALTSALMNLPDPGTIVGGGAGFDERVYAANVYNWVAKFVGAKPEQFDNTVAAREIANKIKVLLGSRTTSQQGFTGEALAQDITRALPGGDMSVEARAEMLASMWIANQEAEDFARYYKTYTQRYKSAYGVNEAFQRDMAPKYDAMKTAVKKAIMPLTQTMPNGSKKTLVDETGKPFSLYNALMTDKNPVEFDKEIGIPGAARVFLGG